MADAWALLQRRVRANAGAPFVTHVDLTTGARTELSAVSVANAASKIANALRQEYDLERGDVVALDLPAHWQRTTWCAGAWTAGCAISLSPHARARLIVTSEAADAGTLALLTEASPGAPVVAVSLHPFGLPISAALPGGVDDVTVVVRQQPDAYLFDPPDGDVPALVQSDGTVSQDEALGAARTLAAEWGLTAGGRLLAGPSLSPQDGLAAAFAVPLVADAAVVLVSGIGDLTVVEATEQVTSRAT